MHFLLNFKDKLEYKVIRTNYENACRTSKSALIKFSFNKIVENKYVSRSCSESTYRVLKPEFSIYMLSSFYN